MKKIVLMIAAAALTCACGTAYKTPEDIERREARKAQNEEMRRQARMESEQEVVGLGYGTVLKSQNTYSVDRVNVDQKQTLGYNNIIDYLRGRVPGLTIGASDGASMPSITIRGKNSINSSTEPLILVDGTPTDNIMWLNPNDVASVDVLKDASASIYGSRGANGVIIINTKTARDAAAAERKVRKEQNAAQKAARKAGKGK